MGPGENQNTRPNRGRAPRSAATASLARVQRDPRRIRPDDLPSDLAVVLSMQNCGPMPTNRSRTLALVARSGSEYPDAKPTLGFASGSFFSRVLFCAYTSLICGDFKRIDVATRSLRGRALGFLRLGLCAR